MTKTSATASQPRTLQSFAQLRASVKPSQTGAVSVSQWNVTFQNGELSGLCTVSPNTAGTTIQMLALGLIDPQTNVVYSGEMLSGADGGALTGAVEALTSTTNFKTSPGGSQILSEIYGIANVNGVDTYFTFSRTFQVSGGR